MVWLLPLIPIGALAYLVINELTKTENMANTNKLFLDLDKAASLTPAQKAKLRASRKALEDKITRALNGKEDISFRGYYIQGSLSPRFNTNIVKKDGTYDVDLGVYFKEKPNITCTTAQKYILDAVSNHTDAGASHLKKCIRVVFAGDFDVDLPVYYQGENDPVPFIAIKNGDWRKDDPKGTSEWFKEKKKGTDGQLVRVIKYLKVWADERNFKMPNGFALTVWAAENFVLDAERDDKSLFETLKKIKNYIYWNGVTCKCPKDPFDNLTDNLDDMQKEKFKTALSSFVSDAEKAINSTNQLEASKLWRNHLGTRFPEGVDEDVDAKEKELKSMAAMVNIGIAKTDKAGNIQTNDGVPNPRHRNFGG